MKREFIVEEFLFQISRGQILYQKIGPENGKQRLSSTNILRIPPTHQYYVFYICKDRKHAEAISISTYKCPQQIANRLMSSKTPRRSVQSKTGHDVPTTALHIPVQSTGSMSQVQLTRPRLKLYYSEQNRIGT